MTLCGGRRGGCFTPDEMKTLQRVTGDMTGAYTRMETMFDTLGRQMRVSCNAAQSIYRQQVAHSAIDT